MVQPKYNPEESLQRVKLIMKYDSSKTLNENKGLIKEQPVDDLEYFKTVAKSLMNNPSQVKNVDFGNPTANIKTAAQAIKNSVGNVGTDFHGLDYILQNGFNNISNSMAIVKNYTSIGGESLYSALNGEWFAGRTKNKIVNQVAEQLMEWCKTKPTINICKPKTADELKYGKI
jgi:hypothetical protein